MMTTTPGKVESFQLGRSYKLQLLFSRTMHALGALLVESFPLRIDKIIEGKITI